MKYFIFALALLAGCTDATLSQLSSVGTSGEVTCYSGGKEIYRGVSTGKISSEQGSDGWFFREQGTNKLIRVSGDCVIKN